MGRKRKVNTENVDISDRARLLREETPFAIREAYIKLRTNLTFCLTTDKERPCRTFAVTSANPSEGKSITAANIAISFALLGKKVILIDADMRKPKQHILWDNKNEHGLSDYLAKRSRLELVKVKNLPHWILGAGTISPNPSELLSLERMKHLVEDCAGISDYVIIDTPPINTVADAQIISSFLDGTVVVARAGETRSGELTHALDQIRGAGGNLCGVILNDVDMKSSKYSYGKYRKKYGYGYSSGY